MRSIHNTPSDARTAKLNSSTTKKPGTIGPTRPVNADDGGKADVESNNTSVPPTLEHEPQPTLVALAGLLCQIILPRRR